ncbi:MAG TPA: adenosylcobinamide-GDP ribazoletransferase [Rhodocyclaceae bacterium]|jgi:adenosylcobinamide-GDP ribazoletransferase
MLQQELRIFFTALGFFTRLPVPAWVGHSAEGLNQAPRYLPLVGILVGLLSVIVTELAAVFLPVSVAVVLSMAATLWLTGALHEDGFADVCDGFGGGWDKEKILVIMKDSRVGSYGAIGIALLLLLKFQILVEVDASGELYDQLLIGNMTALPFALVAGHAVSRLAAVALMTGLDYAREDGKAAPLAHRPGPATSFVAAVFGLIPCLLLPRGPVLVALSLVVVVTVLAGRYFRKHIGGYTGDCLGATQQLTEVAFYMGLLCNFTW